ncbi:MAG TPA: hypothetical protein VGM27_01820 [Acidobacteriaceae bacterium]
MALKLNLGQINNAARGNNDLRETLTGVYNEFQAIYQQVGSSPIQKVDSTPPSFSGPPPLCAFSVTGANGQFSVSIMLPQSGSRGTAPKNSTNAQIYQELSSSTAADFSGAVTTYPLSTNTSYIFPGPGVTLFWRLRSSYDQKAWNNYQVQPAAVSAGKQSSSATENNVSLNQSNFATVDSIANGSSAIVRIYGTGGVGTSWARIVGSASQAVPAGTILNIAYGTDAYVIWDGSRYQLKPSLTQTFPDDWVPVGKVSVIANGSGLVLPVIKAIVVSGAIVAYQIVSGGNDLTAAPAIAITDSSGTGATATAVIEAGAVVQVIPGNAGSGYSSTPTVTASGGVSSGATGGGGALGNNGGRLYADV